MLATIRKSTGILIEMQSHGNSEVMIQTAINCGIHMEDIEVHEVDPSAWDAFLAAHKPPPTSTELVATVDAQLKELDLKSIRALREGNATRVAELEAQASALRIQRAQLLT